MIEIKISTIPTKIGPLREYGLHEDQAEKKKTITKLVTNPASNKGKKRK